MVVAYRLIALTGYFSTSNLQVFRCAQKKGRCDLMHSKTRKKQEGKTKERRTNASPLPFLFKIISDSFSFLSMLLTLTIKMIFVIKNVEYNSVAPKKRIIDKFKVYLYKTPSRL